MEQEKMNDQYDYITKETPRDSEKMSDVKYDEKDDFNFIRSTLASRKKVIYTGLAFMAVVVIAVTVSVVSSGGKETNNKSGISENESKSSDATSENEERLIDSQSGSSISTVLSTSGSGSGWSNVSSADETFDDSSVASDSDVESENPDTPSVSTVSTVSPAVETEATAKDLLPYVAKDFDWKNAGNWEWASQSPAAASMFESDGIKVTSSIQAQPIRTKMGWGGEKIVLVEWERSGGSDTNIWMLNTKLKNQFADGNGWPYWGELDIFEMFTQDQKDKPGYDFMGQMGTPVNGYGQLTMHMGPAWPAPPCFCPASHTKSAWFQGSAPMTSSCTAQFANSEKNSIATVFGSDSNGKFIQLWQYPNVKKGDKGTYDITPGSGPVTMKIYNNDKLFWGVPVSDGCAAAGGHNAASGFPFFEDFRLVLEEQSKPSEGQWFKVTNIQIFNKA